MNKHYTNLPPNEIEDGDWTAVVQVRLTYDGKAYAEHQASQCGCKCFKEYIKRRIAHEINSEAASWVSKVSIENRADQMSER